MNVVHAGPTGWWDSPAAWAGSTLDEYVFHLIGAVSNVMLPPSHEMPSEAIQAIKAQVDAAGPHRPAPPLPLDPVPGVTTAEVWLDEMALADARDFTAAEVELLVVRVGELAARAGEGAVRKWGPAEESDADARPDGRCPMCRTGRVLLGVCLVCDEEGT